MALTSSTMLELGSSLPDFDLHDVVNGGRVRAADFKGGSGLLVMFICSHCPYVKHVEAELARLARDFGDRLGIVAVSANDAQRHPEDAPAGLRAQAERMGLQLPYLHDETQEVARAFSAACTPDFFLYDAAGRLYYRGQLDETRPGGAEAHGADLRAAMTGLLAGEGPPTQQSPSVGCNIKWKPGMEPGQSST